MEDILGNKGVDINGYDYDYNTPLMHAADNGHHDIVRRLLEYPGIQIGKRDGSWPRDSGYTALHWACESNEISIVQLLCQDSKCDPGDVNKKEISGYTPLMIAVDRGYLDIVKELDIEGTDFFTKDGDGGTLTEVARRWNNDDKVLEYLIKRNRVDSLRAIAAHNVARHVKNKADVEALEIPETVRQFLAGFVENEV